MLAQSFCQHYFCTFMTSRVATLRQSNEELRNMNGCYLITQFSYDPNKIQRYFHVGFI